jgi:hypothetical protein
MTILFILMGIIIKKLVAMYPIMGGGIVDTWHDRMYVQCTLVEI